MFCLSRALLVTMLTSALLSLASVTLWLRSRQRQSDPSSMGLPCAEAPSTFRMTR